jgi:ABC-type cobalt transport system substrate-binding protein
MYPQNTPHRHPRNEIESQNFTGQNYGLPVLGFIVGRASGKAHKRQSKTLFFVTLV